MNDFTKHPNFDRQVALEAEMVSRGTDAYRKQVANAKTNNLEFATHYGSYLVRRAIKPVADGIQDFMKAADGGRAGRKHIAVQYLRNVTPGVAAFLTLRTVLNLISSRITLQNAAITVGSALETEARLEYFESANKDEYRKATKAVKRASNEQYRRVVYSYIASKNDIDLPSWSRRDKLLLGQKLIEIVVEVTGYVEIIADHKRKDRLGAYTYHIVGTEKCLDWISRLEEYASLATPEFLPTIIPPRPWENPYEGGYFTIYSPLKLVKTGSPNYLEELTHMADDMPTLYEAINAMQSTGYPNCQKWDHSTLLRCCKAPFFSPNVSNILNDFN